MLQSNRDVGDVDMIKRGNVFPDVEKKIDGKEAPSASSDNSLGDSLSSLSLSSNRMFTSPLTTYKNVLKAGVGTPQAGIKYLNLSSSSPASKELKLDDGQRLRLMSSSNYLTMDDIDDSSESDFDES